MVYRYRATARPAAPATPAPRRPVDPTGQAAATAGALRATAAPAPGASYQCTKCHRKLTLTAADTATPQALAAAVHRTGWAVLPKLLCALHAATAEAYARPATARTRRAPVADPAGPTRLPVPTPR